MKRLFIILCAVMLTFGLAAQTESGTILLEGGTNLTYSSVKLNKVEVDGEDMTEDLEDIGLISTKPTNKLALNLTGGYFMMDGLAGGLIIDYSSESYDGDTTSNKMLIGPMVRYYIGESGVWSQLSYAFGSSDDGDNATDEPKVSSLGLGAGYAVMLSDNIALSPSIGYTMVTEKLDDVKSKYSGIVFKVGIAVHLGN